MVRITNNWIIVSRDDPSFLQLSINLSYLEKEKIRKLPNGREVRIPPKVNKLYTISNNEMFIPLGVLTFLTDYFANSEIKYETIDTIDVSRYINNIDDYTEILPGITLRKYQIIAVRKILYFKRCLVNACTGAGKTEVLCALVKILSEANNGDMTVLLMEPTVKLMNDIYKRFEKYGIKIVKYSENRRIVPNCVNICHPISLGNDLDKDPHLLDNVQVLLADETHHLRSESFRKPTYSMNNLQFSVGVSASAINQDHIGLDNISKYSFDEALVIGATGQIVLNITSKYLIDSGSLANPVLLMVNNPANEDIGKNNVANWIKIAQDVIESDYRTGLVVDSARFFHSVGRKSLILVRTIRHAEKMMEMFYNIGLGDYVRASFGGGAFEGYNNEGIFSDTDVFAKFDSGEHTILIGTSHLYEGVDIPNLDVVILGYGGKGERMQIQGIGRVLRKTKSGKYAYIVDFTDENNLVLAKHSRTRMNRYREIIGIPDNQIYYNIQVDDFREIFKSLEE